MAEQPSLASLARGRVLTPERVVVTNERILQHILRESNGWDPITNYAWMQGWRACFGNVSAYFTGTGSIVSPFEMQVADSLSWVRPPKTVSLRTREIRFQENPFTVYAMRCFPQDSERVVQTRLSRRRPGSFDGVEL